MAESGGVGVPTRCPFHRAPRRVRLSGVRSAALISHLAPPRLVSIDAPPAETEALRGPAAASPLDPGLATVMAVRGRAVTEERLIPLLLLDLQRAPSPGVDAGSADRHS